MKEKSKWRHIGEEAALEHELYGVGGWLLLFAVGCFLGLLADFGRVNGDAHSIGMSLGDYLSISHPSINALKVVLFYEVVAVACIYWMMFAKSRGFRTYTSWLLLVMFPFMVVVSMANTYEGVGAVLVSGFIRWAIGCAIWVSYLHLSKRVRVTFEHCVLDETEVPPEPKPEATSVVNSITATPAVFASAEKAATQNVNEPEEQFWAIALAECNQQNMRPGLWAKAFAESQGQEALAKAHYMRLRATQLQVEHMFRQEQEVAHKKTVEQAEIAQQQELEAEQAIALANMNEDERLEALRPKGRCPNCSAIINADSENCSHCKADFGSGSKWQVKRLTALELRAHSALQTAYAEKTKVQQQGEATRSLIFAVVIILVVIFMATRS